MVLTASHTKLLNGPMEPIKEIEEKNCERLSMRISVLGPGPAKYNPGRLY